MRFHIDSEDYNGVKSQVVRYASYNDTLAYLGHMAAGGHSKDIVAGEVDKENLTAFYENMKGERTTFRASLAYIDGRWWTSSSGEIEIYISTSSAADINTPGESLPEVQELAAQPYIRFQLKDISQDTIREVLEGYGAWDDAELMDKEKNIERLLWIAACDIAEESYNGD